MPLLILPLILSASEGPKAKLALGIKPCPFVERSQFLPLDSTYFLKRTANIKEVLVNIKKLMGLTIPITAGLE
jgi:hypothetical protein